MCSGCLESAVSTSIVTTIFSCVLAYIAAGGPGEFFGFLTILLVAKLRLAEAASDFGTTFGFKLIRTGFENLGDTLFFYYPGSYTRLEVKVKKIGQKG